MDSTTTHPVSVVQRTFVLLTFVSRRSVTSGTLSGKSVPSGWEDQDADFGFYLEDPEEQTNDAPSISTHAMA
jgi:hypothetical protein